MTDRSFIIDTLAKQAVKTIAELLFIPGKLNIGLDDIKAVMDQPGPVLVTAGTGKGRNRTVDACQAALSNPLIGLSMPKIASKVLLNITGPSNLCLKEVNDAIETVKTRISTLAEVVPGVIINGQLDDEVRVILIAELSGSTEVNENIQPRQGIASLVKKWWEEAGRPNLTLDETVNLVKKADAHPDSKKNAKKLRKHIQEGDEAYVRTWTQGCHFCWINPRISD